MRLICAWGCRRCAFVRPRLNQHIDVGKAGAAAESMARIDNNGAETDGFSHAGEGNGDVNAADHPQAA